jgi:hypothetical protein
MVLRRRLSVTLPFSIFSLAKIVSQTPIKSQEKYRNVTCEALINQNNHGSSADVPHEQTVGTV